ncbi:MAG: hypothetical protein AVDCRST_MAG22-2161, partial [uncultured Rubrobacteraceae bacterium]
WSARMSGCARRTPSFVARSGSRALPRAIPATPTPTTAVQRDPSSPRWRGGPRARDG